MSFGKTYHYEKQLKVLADGDYTIVLGVPQETQVAGYDVLRFPFAVKGTEEKCIPNYFDLFDCVDPDDPKALGTFRRRASKIKECFKLTGSFCISNYMEWVGHEGKVKIAKSKDGFINVIDFYPAEMTEEERNLL